MQATTKLILLFALAFGLVVWHLPVLLVARVVSVCVRVRACGAIILNCNIRNC